MQFVYILANERILKLEFNFLLFPVQLSFGYKEEKKRTGKYCKIQHFGPFLVNTNNGHKNISNKCSTKTRPADSMAVVHFIF